MVGQNAERVADKAGMMQWLFEHSRDLMHVATPDRVLVVVNPAWCEHSGLSEAELIGRRTTDFYHPDDFAALEPGIVAMRPGDVAHNEIRVLRADGEYQWFLSSGQRMDDGGYVVSLRDISADRARRDEIDEARRTTKLLGAAAGIGIWEFDPVTNRISGSDEMLALTGFDPGVTGTPEQFLAQIHPRDRQRVDRALQTAVATGASIRLEHRVWERDHWAAIRVTVHTQPRPGGIYALKGVSENITELVEARDAARLGEQQARRARREVQATARRLNLALQAAEAGVYEIDHMRQTFWCSPEFARISQQRNPTYEDARSLRFPRFHPDDVPHVRESFRALHRGDRSSGDSFEARILRADGTERWVRVSHHLKVARNGRWLKAVGLMQDCDELKRQELVLKDAQCAAEAAAEAKAAFLANMSHEIRTPLNGVMGVLHLLESEPLSADGRGLLREALSCGQMLGELLNDVIDFSKIEAGRLELASEPLDPCALVGGVARLLEPQARAKGLRLIVDVDEGVGWVRSDPVRLRQALFNLVGNAVKFTESGHVRVHCCRSPAGLLRFEVEDTGVGIPEAAQPRLFERFNQADASTTRKFGGSGLGLAITRRLAEMMQGSVGFRSREDQGSTFWFEVVADSTEAVGAPVQPSLAVLEGLRVLVVEDNATNRLIATRLIESLGGDVETADDGYAGVEAAARGAFDVILMDIQMPGIDGLEAARRIRSLGGEIAATPIIALTANVLSHQRAAYLDAGMDGVVGKPISPAALLAEIGAAAASRDEPAQFARRGEDGKPAAVARGGRR